MSSDLFPRSEVATVAGMAGTCGNAGLLAFNLLIGGLVTTVGYAPFFVCLGVLDLVAAAVLWGVVREPVRFGDRSTDYMDYMDSTDTSR
jgi:ACS family hexuronate transporter-like MFS transporter